jgi:hypothetical protein
MVSLAGFEPATACLEDRRSDSAELQARISSEFQLEFGAQGRTQTFNLWFVGPALHQLSYSGERL